MGQIGTLPDFYRFRAKLQGAHAARSVQDRAISLRGNPSVIFAEEQTAKQQAPRKEAPTM